MRIGGASHAFSAHQAGMSALWHDVDYIPEKRFETPMVRTGLEDMALPSEHHQLPDGVADPFQRMEAIFDVAAQQMERGLKGANFLHGKPPPEATLKAMEDAAPQAKRPESRMSFEERRTREQQRMVNQASAVTIPKSKSATKTAADKDSEGVAATGATSGKDVSDALGVAATFVPMAAGQAVTTVIQGPLPALASTAVSVTGAVATAGQLTATGIAKGLEEEPVIIRRGLKTRV